MIAKITKIVPWSERFERKLSEIPNLSAGKDIAIPEYTFRSDGKNIIIEQEYIKGHTFMCPITATKDNYDLVYSDLVTGYGIGGFEDFAFDNFVMCRKTEKIYYVDLEAFHYNDWNVRHDNFVRKFIRDIKRFHNPWDLSWVNDWIKIYEN